MRRGESYGDGHSETPVCAPEEQLCPQAIRHIGQSVFDHNTNSRALNVTMGHRVATTSTLKRIASDAGQEDQGGQVGTENSPMSHVTAYNDRTRAALSALG